jgi:hypothetical protein
MGRLMVEVIVSSVQLVITWLAEATAQATTMKRRMRKAVMLVGQLRSSVIDK